MALLGLDRGTIRKAVGRNLLGSAIIIGSPTNIAGSPALFIDTSLFHGDEDLNGYWIWWTAGNNLNTESRAKTFASSSQTVTLQASTSGAIQATDTYELWSPEYRPSVINDFINDAIRASVGRFYNPQESLALFADGKVRRFDIPSEFDALQTVLNRRSVASRKIHSIESIWDESVDSDFTITGDTKDKKRGSQSLKMVVAGTVSDSDKVTDSITSIDLSDMTHVELWIKVTTAVVSNDLQLLLDDTASCVSPIETLTIPALVADTWTYVRIALSTAELDTAIISVGLEYNANAGANTIWIDDIKAVNNDTADYVEINRHLWSVDQEERDLIFKPDALSQAGYSLLKLKGGQDAAALSLDADLPVVNEKYIIEYATALASGGGSRRSDEDPEGRRSSAAFWYGQARRSKSSFPPLVNVRRV